MTREATPPFFPDPRDGTLYALSLNGDNLEVSDVLMLLCSICLLCVVVVIVQKFPMSIPEMAQSSPLQSSDGTVYVGKEFVVICCSELLIYFIIKGIFVL